MTRWLSLLAALALVSVAAPAEAQSIQNAMVSAYGRFGFAGSGDLYADTSVLHTHATGDLQPTAGFGLRGEATLFDFLSVGGFFEAASYQVSGNFGAVHVDTSRRWMFDIDAFVKGRWLFEAIPNELYLEPYVLVPIGLTLGALTNLDNNDDRTWPGWSSGAMLGLTLLSAMGVGGFVELGWRHHEVYTSETILTVDTHASWALNQFALNAGLAYAWR